MAPEGPNLHPQPRGDDHEGRVDSTLTVLSQRCWERPLDRLSVISDIAHVLGIDPPLLLLGHPDRGPGAASHPRQTPATELDTGTARRDVEILINRHLTAGPTRDVRETRLLRRLLTLAYAAMTAEDIPLQVRCRVMATVLSHHEIGRR